VIETIFDVGMLIADLAILASDLYYYLVLHPCASRTEMWAVLSVDTTAIALDLLCMMIPFLPGGGGLVYALAGRGAAGAARVAYQGARAWQVGSWAFRGIQGVRAAIALMASGRGGGHRRGGSGGSSSGRGLKPDERKHVERISKVDVDKYIRKHPLALTEPPGGPHVEETNQLIRRLENSVDVLKRIVPYLDETSRATVLDAIREGEQKIRTLLDWLSRRTTP
jgi:hypothetical protein